MVPFLAATFCPTDAAALLRELAKPTPACFSFKTDANFVHHVYAIPVSFLFQLRV
jgi:hypothetical protein